MRMTAVSSGRITTQALTSGEPSAARAIVGPPKGISRPSARPVPTAAVPMTKVRRLRGGLWFIAASSNVRGGVDCLPPPLEGAPAADICDGFVDVLFRRLPPLPSERPPPHAHA